MLTRKQLEEEAKKYSMFQIVYMLSLKCKEKKKNGGCTGCDYLNCHDECCLCGIDVDIDPSEWKDIYVEQEEE